MDTPNLIGTSGEIFQLCADHYWSSFTDDYPILDGYGDESFDTVGGGILIT